MVTRPVASFFVTLRIVEVFFAFIVFTVPASIDLCAYLQTSPNLLLNFGQGTSTNFTL